MEITTNERNNMLADYSQPIDGIETAKFFASDNRTFVRGPYTSFDQAATENPGAWITCTATPGLERKAS